MKIRIPFDALPPFVSFPDMVNVATDHILDTYFPEQSEDMVMLGYGPEYFDVQANAVIVTIRSITDIVDTIH